MRPNRIASIAAAVAGLTAAACAPALGGACSREVVARIRTPPGEPCWTYRGTATVFVGKLSNGRTISVQMTGESTEYDPRTGQVATRWRPRDPNVEGPGGYFDGDAEAPGLMTFVAPANGDYRFSFSPCAMWGEPGVVRICAR